MGWLLSRPMGFYTPSQLIQDARRHDVTVLPVDVNHSGWDHQLLDDGARGAKAPIRLGLRIIKSLSRDAATRIVEAPVPNGAVTSPPTSSDGNKLGLTNDWKMNSLVSPCSDRDTNSVEHAKRSFQVEIGEIFCSVHF